MITLLALTQAALIFTLGYLTCKIRRNVADNKFRDELYSAICNKIRETEIYNVKIEEEV